MKPVMPAALSSCGRRVRAAIAPANSASNTLGAPITWRASSFTVPLGAPCASTPMKGLNCAKSPANVAFDKPTTLPRVFLARASAALLKAPWWPSLPSS